MTTRLVSWNVNGIRAACKKGFAASMRQLDADVIAIQETKAQPEQLDDAILNFDDYRSWWHSAEKKGYSGVAMYSRKPPLNVIIGLDAPEFDIEGRCITLEFEDFYLINLYFPNAQAELKRIEYRLRFNQTLHSFANKLARAKCVVVCGDFNVAHRPIDLTHPKPNEKNPGYSLPERQWMDTFLERDFIDTFRHCNKGPEHYTWWSYRANARPRNVGWRIDYFCIDQANKARIHNTGIEAHILGSDHCPTVLDLASL